MNQFAERILKNPNLRQNILMFGRNYLFYIKYPIGLGGLLGAGLGVSYLLDKQDENNHKITRVEKSFYVIGGTIAGCAFGATFPFWCVFAPISYVIGNDFASALVKIALGAIILSDDSEKRKNDGQPTNNN